MKVARHRTFSGLSRALRKHGDNVVENATKSIQDAAIFGYNTLIFITPIDTGRARVSWTISFGAPVDGDVGPGKYPNSAPYVSRAVSTIKAWQLVNGSLFISNSVPYIEELDKGHSVQAPNGFTVQAVESIQKVLRTARLLS